MYRKVSERTKVAMSDFLGRRWTTERGSWTNSATPRTSTLISRPCRDLHLTNASVCVSRTHRDLLDESLAYPFRLSRGTARSATWRRRVRMLISSFSTRGWRSWDSTVVHSLRKSFQTSTNYLFFSTSWFSQHSPRCAIELSSVVFRKLAHYARSVSWHISQALDTKHRYFLSSQLTVAVVSMSRKRRKKIVDLFRDWKLAKIVASLLAINSLATPRPKLRFRV